MLVAAIYAGKLAAYWNLPHFSFSSTNPELMDKIMFSSLVRVMSPFNHLATALRHVFSFFRVNNFGTIDKYPVDTVLPVHIVYGIMKPPLNLPLKMAE